jgi:rare lipoprotein A
MKNILRGIGIIGALLVAFMLMTSCTPGKAQTRTTNDGAASHNFDNGKEPVAKSGYSSDDQTYGSDDDFDIESKDIDAPPAKVKTAAKSRPAASEQEAVPAKTKVAAKTRQSVEDLDSDADMDAVDEQPVPVVKAKKKTESEPAAVSGDSYFQKGVASWYGREFHGKKTASGEKFNMNELTAAHKTLPLGSVILVKNLDNGKIVKVRVNDRGPYKGKRILDLSFAAAKKIGMVSDGEAMVGIKVIGSGSQAYAGDQAEVDEPAAGLSEDDEAPAVKKKASVSESRGNFAIQTGAFLSKRNAEKLRAHLADTFPDNEVIVFSDGDLYKVQVKDIASKSEAEKYKRILGKEKVTAFTVHQE